MVKKKEANRTSISNSCELFCMYVIYMYQFDNFFRDPDLVEEDTRKHTKGIAGAYRGKKKRKLLKN